MACLGDLDVIIPLLDGLDGRFPQPLSSQQVVVALLDRQRHIL
jgi:hypothetical protein